MVVKPLPISFHVKSIEHYYNTDSINILVYDSTSILLEINHLQLEKNYLIKILVNHLGYPKVYMMKNEFQKEKLIRETPHIYTEDSRLCLYYPGEWKRNMHFSITILPWTIEWLIAYEYWLKNREWIGKEIRHDKNK